MSLIDSNFIYILIVFAFGCFMGSFFNVLIWRLPQERSIGGRSECPNCKHILGAQDLIPVFSYIFAGGRCRYCKKTISLRYPVIEIITGLLFAASFYYFPPTSLLTTLIFLKAIIVVSVALLVFVIDLEHFLILDRIIFPAMALILILLIATSIVSGSYSILVISLLSALGTFIPFWMIWFLSKGKWMGFGDVKLVALMGLILGWPGIATALFLAFITGAIIGVALIVAGKKNLSSKLPFGTFLSIALVIALFYGFPIWEAYWSLFQI